MNDRNTPDTENAHVLAHRKEHGWINGNSFKRQLEGGSPDPAHMNLVKPNGQPFISQRHLAMTKWFELVGKYIETRVRGTQGSHAIQIPSIPRGQQHQYMTHSMLHDNSEFYMEETIEYERAERLALYRMLQLAGETVMVEWFPEVLDEIPEYSTDAHWQITYTYGQLHRW